MRNVDAEEDIPEVLRALIAPVRPHGCIFAYTGGARKSIRGHFSFFELNQAQMEKVLKHQIGMLGRGDNIYCMLSGQFTPKQRTIVQKRMMFPPDLYFDILSWWINESGHPGFCNLPLPENCPSPIFVDNEESENNIDTEVDRKVEEKFEGGQYFF